MNTDRPNDMAPYTPRQPSGRLSGPTLPGSALPCPQTERSSVASTASAAFSAPCHTIVQSAPELARGPPRRPPAPVHRPCPATAVDMRRRARRRRRPRPRPDRRARRRQDTPVPGSGAVPTPRDHLRRVPDHLRRRVTIDQGHHPITHSGRCPGTWRSSETKAPSPSPRWARSQVSEPPIGPRRARGPSGSRSPPP